MGKTADAIAEGVIIAVAAARLAVRNHILVEAITHDASFSFDSLRPFARDALEALAAEQEAAGERARKDWRRAWGRSSDPNGTHDYRGRDTRNLRRRARQYKGVAAELRRRAEDDAQLDEIIEQARDAAWGDVKANLDRRLIFEAERPDLDPDYGSLRAARMQSLRLIDLPRLAAHQRRASRRTGTGIDEEGAVTDDAASVRRSGIDLSELE